MGIGVYEAKTYIAQNSGTISVKSILNEGSTFTVLFPIIKN